MTLNFVKLNRSASILLLVLVVAFAPGKVGAQEPRASGAKLAQAAAGSAKPLVAVSILPQAEFVQRIAGDRVDVLTLVGPGASPHSYEPTPRQMADLSRAQVWFTIGVEFEIPLVPKVKSLYPKMLLVDTAKDVKLRKLDADPDGDSGWDPHTWLGYEASKQEITVIYQTLAKAFPSSAGYFRDNYTRYIADIDSVFARLSKKLAPYKGTTIYVYHPSFGYFLDTFGIAQKAVEVGGKEPTQKDLAELIKQAQKDKVKIVFVQKQFSKTAANAVASAIGGKVVEIDPLAPDWLNNIEVIGNAIALSEAK